ncbi:DNA/RNA polymerase superfamily protein [Abeliophyllum distichum]|uniref:DNA/RNA polymerase superfamily protein n=1 Tax=Abeliophyllum distichum TaxID=126358 RepID=A0ABD1UNC7_9LAMI
MTVRGSGSQSGTWTSRSTSSQKNRRGFWPGVANTAVSRLSLEGARVQSPSQRPVASTQGGSSSHARFPQCQLCGRFHLGECLRGAGVCYQCGQVGHMKRDCPDRPQGSGAPQVQPGVSAARQAQNQNQNTGVSGASMTREAHANITSSSSVQQKG